jgi:hypothetical protein
VFTNTTDERQNLMVDLKWTDPLNTGSSTGSFNGPPVRQYNLYYRKVPSLTWTTTLLDVSNVIIETPGSQQRRFILRNLENENKYDIKIEPINQIGTGPESAIITARTLMKPSIPTNVVVTSKYGLLLGSSRNYINIAWDKPDTGGNPITIYYITITPPTPLQPLTILYNVPSTDTRTSFNSDIGRFGQNDLITGTYSVVIQAYNGYLNGLETTVAYVNVKPTTAKATIASIVGVYNANGLDYAQMTFSINTALVDTNKISTVKVNGLDNSFQTSLNIFNQEITGTGEHKIRIPAIQDGRDTIIVVGTSYSVSITLVFSLTNEEQTSDSIDYVPEIKYSSS